MNRKLLQEAIWNTVRLPAIIFLGYGLFFFIAYAILQFFGTMVGIIVVVSLVLIAVFVYAVLSEYGRLLSRGRY
jgi:hypothetical protein